MKTAHVLKYTSFLAKNNDAPFSIKELVLNSAVNSAIFYGCESWLSNDLKIAEATYSSLLKDLLDVRQQTPGVLVLLELGLPDATSFIRDKQKRFFTNIQRRNSYTESYLQKVIDLAIAVNSPMGKVLSEILHSDSSYTQTCLTKLCDTVRQCHYPEQNIYRNKPSIEET